MSQDERLFCAAWYQSLMCTVASEVCEGFLWFDALLGPPASCRLMVHGRIVGRLLCACQKSDSLSRWESSRSWLQASPDLLFPTVHASPDRGSDQSFGSRGSRGSGISKQSSVPSHPINTLKHSRAVRAAIAEDISFVDQLIQSYKKSPRQVAS